MTNPVIAPELLQLGKATPEEYLQTVCTMDAAQLAALCQTMGINPSSRGAEAELRIRCQRLASYDLAMPDATLINLAA